MSVTSKVPDSATRAEGAVLLLPGMALNATIFPRLGLPAVTVDFSGFRPPMAAEDRLREPPDGERWMGAYITELDRQLDTPRWRVARPRIVVGHSFGGMLALAWWLHHRGTGPARIDGMLLVSTTAGPMYDAVRVRLLPGGGAHDPRMGIAPLMRVWNSRLVTRAVHHVLAGREWRAVDFQRLTRRTDIAVGLAGWRATAWPARRGYRSAMWGFDVRDRLPEIHVPTIVLFGTRDSLFPVACGEELARRMPRAELRVLPGAPHVLPLTHGHEIVRAVHELLEARPVAPPPDTAGDTAGLSA